MKINGPFTGDLPVFFSHLRSDKCSDRKALNKRDSDIFCHESCGFWDSYTLPSSFARILLCWKTKAEEYSEKALQFYQTNWRKHPRRRQLHGHHCENVKWCGHSTFFLNSPLPFCVTILTVLIPLSSVVLVLHTSIYAFNHSLPFMLCCFCSCSCCCCLLLPERRHKIVCCNFLRKAFSLRRLDLSV